MPKEMYQQNQINFNMASNINIEGNQQLVKNQNMQMPQQ